MLALRGVFRGVSNYMMFDASQGPWRTVELGVFANNPEVFSPIYDYNAVAGTARFPTGVRVRLNLLKPQYINYSASEHAGFSYAFPVFEAWTGANDSTFFQEPWKLTELDLRGIPFSEILVQNNGLTYLNISDNIKLEKLDCSINSLTDANFDATGSGLNISGYPEYVASDPAYVVFTEVRAYSNSLTTAPFIGLTDHIIQDEYDVNANNISSIAVASYPPRRLDVSNQFPTDASQGLTSLTFADALNRPDYWYVQQNRLTSLDLGITGTGTDFGWGRIRDLDCSDNLIGSLVFPDGPPPAGYYGGGVTPGGYQLRTLKAGGNPVTTINLTYVDTLLELNLSGASLLSSLTLPASVVRTYPYNDSDAFAFDINNNRTTDLVTGQWYTAFGASSSTNSSLLYRHTSGVRSLNLNGCAALTAWPSSGTDAIRTLDVSGTGITTLNSSGFCSDLFAAGAVATWKSFGVTTDNLGRYGFKLSVAADHSTATSSAYTDVGRWVAVFKNLTFSAAALPIGTRAPQSMVGYPLHSAIKFYVPSGTAVFYITESSDFESIISSTISMNNVTGGQVALFRQGGMPFLETLTIDGCPNLTTVNLKGCTMLSTLAINNCPKLTGTLLNGIRSTTTYYGYSGHLTNMSVTNSGTATGTAGLSLLREQSPAYRMEFSKLKVASSKIVALRVGKSPATDTDTNTGTYTCRNGAYFTGLTSSAQTNLDSAVESMLTRAGTWSFSPALATDSNVLSFAGTAYSSSRTATFYNGYKTTAGSRGWAVTDPTFV